MSNKKWTFELTHQRIVLVQIWGQKYEVAMTLTMNVLFMIVIALVKSVDFMMMTIANPNVVIMMMRIFLGRQENDHTTTCCST